jgi:hypothetical protein
MINYFLMIYDVSVDNEALFVTDFINLKIKLTRSFKCSLSNIVYVYLYR